MTYELYSWRERFVRAGLTYDVRMEFLELLKPHVKLMSLIPSSAAVGREEVAEKALRVSDVVGWEIVLGASDIHEIIASVEDRPEWKAALFELLPSFSSLLLEALDLMRELEGADRRSDGSYSYQPSIRRHPQNRAFRDWTALIDLVRDAFLVASELDPRGARAEVWRWLSFPYPIFKRLAFFAASDTDLFDAPVALRWLLAEDSWWLWSVETEPETIRLLAKLAQRLLPVDEHELLSAILLGPPQEMLSFLEGEVASRVFDREIWFRLSKYQAESKKPLEGSAAATLDRISRQHPEWKIAPDESDEFPVWVGEAEDWYRKENSPLAPSALEEWLLLERKELSNDDWSDRCKDDFAVAIAALANLAGAGSWPIPRWRTALSIWSDDSLSLESWRILKDLLLAADDFVFERLAEPLGWWLHALGKVIVEGGQQFHELALRLLATQTHEPYIPAKDPLFKAINHPVGQVTDAIFRWWYRQDLRDDQGLNDDPRRVFDLLCTEDRPAFRYGRILLAANAIALFRVDRVWTTGHVLPTLNWGANFDEAKAAWSGFLWAARLYPPLLASIKTEFLQTAGRYALLGDFGSRYADLLTYAALEASDVFSKREFALATEMLPVEGLNSCAISLVRSLQSAGERRVEYWKNRLHPYIKDIWPKSTSASSRSIALSFARICMKAGDAFPEAVSMLKPWLSSVTQGDVLLNEFATTDLAQRFPEDSLAFLDAVLSEKPPLLPNHLSTALEQIRAQRPELEQDTRYLRLARRVREIG